MPIQVENVGSLFFASSLLFPTLSRNQLVDALDNLGVVTCEVYEVSFQQLVEARMESVGPIDWMMG